LVEKIKGEGRGGEVSGVWCRGIWYQVYQMLVGRGSCLSW